MISKGLKSRSVKRLTSAPLEVVVEGRTLADRLRLRLYEFDYERRLLQEHEVAKWRKMLGERGGILKAIDEIEQYIGTETAMKLLNLWNVEVKKTLKVQDERS